MGSLRTASRTVAALATLVVVVVGAQLAGPEPAAAIPGLERKGHWVLSDEPFKRVRAQCPAGKDVIGGGAWADDGGRKKVRLTSMQPLHDYGGETDFFEAVAEAPHLFSGYDWHLGAFAICANPLPGYKVVHGQFTERSSKTFQTAVAGCPSGTVAYSAGATILWAEGRVGLQLSRTSGPLDITRAAAREDTVPFAGEWQLASSAVCAAPRNGIHAEGEIAQGSEASSTCDGTSLVHGAGGGGGLTDGGPVWLQKVYPRHGLKAVDVALTGPLNPSIGGMVAHHTCAT